MTTVNQERSVPTATPVLPPGPRPWPVLGNLLPFQRDPLGYLQYLQRIYGDMATVHIGRMPMVFLFRPEYVRYILVEQPRKFRNRDVALGDDTTAREGLLTIDGEKHRQQRRAVQPAFHKKRVDSYATDIVAYTQELLQRWQVGDTVNITHDMQALTLRIVCKCLFDIDFATQLDTLGATFNDMLGTQNGILDTLFNVRIDNPLTSYGRRKNAMRKMNMLIYTLLAQRRAETGGEHYDVLSMLLDAEDGEQPNQTLSDKQIHDHILTFIAAGHETTALALSWTFYLLARHPEVRAKLQSELHTVLGGRTPTLEDIPKLTYTDWVLSESMRLYPPAWLQARYATEDFELGGTSFTAGTRLVVSQWVLHRSPDYWEQPEVFRPERWDPANGDPAPPGAYFPFGGGPRICIGMPFAQLEARLVLAMVMQRFDPQVPADYEPGILPVITLRPRRPLLARLLPAPTADAASNWEPHMLAPAPLAVQENRGCRPALLNLLGGLRL